MTTFEKIREQVKRIPPGTVATYGQIALLAGNPRWSRVVGYVLNTDGGDLPCQRVVNRFGGLSDAFSPMGRETHRLLLEMEGVEFTPEGNVDLDRFQWSGE